MNRKSNTKPRAEKGLKTPVTAPGRGQAKVNCADLTRSKFGVSKDQKQHIFGQHISAPVKKIPNVHSSAGSHGPGGGSETQAWRQLGQERQRNKILQLEVERLRKSLEVCKKTVKEKNNEIEHKNKLINKLMEDKTRIESTEDLMEDDIDIDNLLHANLGEVDLSDILNLNDSAFPDNLENLDITNMMSEQSLSLSPASLGMATNTSYFVQEEPFQLPNREGSTEEEQSVEVKGPVGRMVEQKNSFLSASQEKSQLKVSPIKIIRGENQYKLASRKRHDGQEALNCVDTPSSKKQKISGKAIPSAPQCLSCSHCDKKFPLGGQWKLTRHISSVHGNIMSYSCQYCDKQFPHQSILLAHTKWHEVTNPWQCEECGYRLGSLAQFVKHVRSVHRVNSLDRARVLLVSTENCN